MKNLLLLFLLFPYFGYSQVRIDSLLNHIQNDYEQTGTRNYLMTDFLIYENQDKRDRYDI